MPPVTPEGLLLQRIADRLDAIHELLQQKPDQGEQPDASAAGKAAAGQEDEGRVEVRGADAPRPTPRRTRNRK